MRTRAARLLLLIALLAYSAAANARPAPLSIEVLQCTVFESTLNYERSLDGGPGFSAHLVSYESAGLTVYAMVAVPDGDSPESGFPILIANHGHHPDPPNYGITSGGVDSRPGDYYRDVPELYTQQGYVVVMPDFRGHNVSEGLEFTGGLLESRYYTEDVLALLASLDDLDDVDLENVFMWGHSMGGEVTLRTLVATDRIKGASLWSSVGGEIWDQAYYYSRLADPLAKDDNDTEKPASEALRRHIEELDDAFDWRESEPLRYLDDLTTPIVIHHAIGDRSAAYKWSAHLAKELHLRGQPYAFFSYEGDEHLFTGDARTLAVARDAEFFRSLMAGAGEDRGSRMTSNGRFLSDTPAAGTCPE